MAHSIVECEPFTGTRSAEGIMASGPVSRTDRPNTWLLRPALLRAQSLDSLEPSTHGPSATSRVGPTMPAFGPEAEAPVIKPWFMNSRPRAPVGSGSSSADRKGNRWQRSPDPRAHHEATVQAGEEGIRFPLVSGKPLREPVADRDEHAGPVATGGPRASGRDLHRERLSRMRCCNCIAAAALPCARDPTQSRNRCGRASILICGTFAHEVLNSDTQYRGIWTAGTGRRRACRVRRSNARDRLPDCQFVRPRCRRQSYFVALTSHGVALPILTSPLSIAI